ncbi:LptF/LptG family permease [Myxococcota bacterium]|nr:LptF/LptG family permease [Myxococcota bacterium]MCZ7618859.1 LptF/LptG family permease [Myxococcota bacterium]
MPGLLSRDLLWRFLIGFAATLVVLALAVAVIDLLGDFEDILAASQGFVGVLLYVGLRIPSHWLPLLVPAAAFVAAFLAVGTAARALEFVAIKASGISPLRVLAPLLLAGVVISGLGLVTNETVAIRSHEAWRRLTGGDERQVEFRRGSFWYHKGRYIYNVRDADPEARELRQVAIFQLDARGRLRRSIHAASARIDGEGRWQLTDAVIRRFQPGDPEAPVAFERLAETELVLTEEVALFEAGVQGLSIAALREYRNGRPADDPEALRAVALLHDRLTKPLAAFVFVLLAIPLGLRVERTHSLAVPALQGVALLFGFSTLREYGATLASQGVTAPSLTPWLILLAFTLGGGWLLSRTPR